MRVAWVHPTWRDLVIERLAQDADLRRHFLARCGPHGIVLALSTGGGAEGERALPLISDDEDWDAVGDRIYALVPELDHAELAAVLRAVRTALGAVSTRNWVAAGEARVLARMALERTAAVWEESGTPVLLDCVDAWLSLSARLEPHVWPTFLAATWAELLPASVPDTRDLIELQRFTDWVALCELLGEFSPELLDELGYGPDQNALIRWFREGGHAGGAEASLWREGPSMPRAEDPGRPFADEIVRRVLADL